jgi:RNA polymerase sigma-70 factor (ECF subfamily)
LETSKKSRNIALEKRQIEAAKLNPAHFAPLYNTYFKPIYIFIFKKVKNEDLAGDITSKVFLKALLNIKKYKHMGFPFSSWLYRIASNEVNLHYRQLNKTTEVELLEKDVIALLDEIDHPEDIQQQERMLNALNNLPLHTAELIEMRFFEKLSFNEIGAVLGLKPVTAKIRVYRALDKLKKQILTT